MLANCGRQAIQHRGTRMEPISVCVLQFIDGNGRRRCHPEGLPERAAVFAAEEMTAAGMEVRVIKYAVRIADNGTAALEPIGEPWQPAQTATPSRA